MREKYESLPLAELKAVAKARGIKGLSTMKKDEVVEAMLMEDEREKKEARLWISKEDSAFCNGSCINYVFNKCIVYQLCTTLFTDDGYKYRSPSI